MGPVHCSLRLSAHAHRIAALIVVAVVMNAGGALADESKAQERRAQNRAKIMNHTKQVQRRYENFEKKLNSSKYLEDQKKLPIPKSYAPKLGLKNEAANQARSSRLPQNSGKLWQKLTPAERAAIRNLGWNRQSWEQRNQSSEPFPNRFPRRN